ncbi:unnamed protein product [Periconia digitata]|uniref:Solute carrier family 40 member n=1 Tax=Periconia digitata TaxID=1303443 RepID=A0A9W4XVR1_9PLEO|nr:unnamed protein product [Periconia digitata]
MASSSTPSVVPSSEAASTHSPNDPETVAQRQRPQAMTRTLWKLYVSHTLSTWNARTFEFGCIIFLATIFPGTLFYASTYALFRAAAATVLSSRIGRLVDSKERLYFLRQSIVFQRFSVAFSCLLLLALLHPTVATNRPWTLLLFSFCSILACVEKLAFIGNTVAVERDWAVVIADKLQIPREDLNSGLRRIDLICKLVAPLCVSLVEAYSTRIAIWAILGQTLASVGLEYFALVHVYAAIPELARSKNTLLTPTMLSGSEQTSVSLFSFATPWKAYWHNPAFLASFSLSLLYLTTLSFASQMTTYLLTLGFTSVSISIFRLLAVAVELSATCAAQLLIRRIGAIRAGLWFVNEQLVSIALATGLFSFLHGKGKIAGVALIAGVTLSRLGLWGFDLSVQYLVQESTLEASRGSFSAVEASLQNFFEMLSFAMTMIFAAPEQFKYPVYISAGAIALSAVCFASFVRQKRGHLLHTSRCLEKRRMKVRYNVLPTIEEENEFEDTLTPVPSSSLP